MSKKIWIAGLIALALVLGVVGVAAAATDQSAQSSVVADPPFPENPPGPMGGPGAGPLWHHPRLKGEIISIGADQFTISGPNDKHIVVEVDDLTSYIGSLEDFADLHVGDQVAVEGHRSGEGTLIARVIVLTEDLPLGIPMPGKVTSVTSGKLTIEVREGLSLSFTVISDTDFLSKDNHVQSISDVQVGEHVLVLFEQTSSGTLTANLILVGQPPEGAD